MAKGVIGIPGTGYRVRYLGDQLVSCECRPRPFETVGHEGGVQGRLGEPVLGLECRVSQLQGVVEFGHYNSPNANRLNT